MTINVNFNPMDQKDLEALKSLTDRVCATEMFIKGADLPPFSDVPEALLKKELMEKQAKMLKAVESMPKSTPENAQELQERQAAMMEAVASMPHKVDRTIGATEDEITSGQYSDDVEVDNQITDNVVPFEKKKYTLDALRPIALEKTRTNAQEQEQLSKKLPDFGANKWSEIEEDKAEEIAAWMREIGWLDA